MGSSHSNKVPDIRLGKRLSQGFHQLQESIREKAYQLSLARDPDQGNPESDWLEAEAELLKPVELEVKDQKKNTVVELTLKDFAPREVEIEVVGNVLQIFGTHTETSRSGRGDSGGSTSKTQSFFRTVPLSAPVDADQTQVKLLKNGKLKVVLPKKLG